MIRLKVYRIFFITYFIIKSRCFFLQSWGRKAKLNDLWDILKKSGALLKEVPNTVTCNHDDVSSMKEFVDTKIFSTIIKNNSLHLEWLVEKC